MNSSEDSYAGLNSKDGSSNDTSFEEIPSTPSPTETKRFKLLKSSNVHCSHSSTDDDSLMVIPASDDEEDVNIIPVGGIEKFKVLSSNSNVPLSLIQNIDASPGTLLNSDKVDMQMCAQTIDLDDSEENGNVFCSPTNTIMKAARYVPVTQTSHDVAAQSSSRGNIHETSTPLMSVRRKHFATEQDLDVTAIDSMESKFNATVYNMTSSEDEVTAISHSIDTLQIDRKAAITKCEGTNVHGGKKKKKIPIIVSDEESEVKTTTSSDTVNISESSQDYHNRSASSVDSRSKSLSHSDSDDDDCLLYEVKEPKKSKDPKIKLPLQKPAEENKRSEKEYGYNKVTVFHEFKGGVQNTITLLADIIEDMPTPDANTNQDDKKLRHLKVDLFEHQVYGLQWLYWREQQFPGGGILADEMGLGKTLMIIALVIKTKNEKKEDIENVKSMWTGEKSSHNFVPSRSTLVVCPAGMLRQWEQEIVTKAKGLSYLIFHGPKRKSSASVLAQHDFVVTTYQTLGSEIPKSEQRSQSPLARVRWERVVLDEGHIIRNPKTRAAHGVGQLESSYRWVVTGTPVHNSALDMFSLMSFLRLTPFNEKKVWEFWIGFKNINEANAARLQTIGKSLLLRRTKAEVEASSNNEGRQIPSKTVIDVEVELSEGEREIYDHLHDFAENQFKMFLKNAEARADEMQRAAANYVQGRAGVKVLGPTMAVTHVFTLILRLRQASVLPHLIQTMIEEDDSDLNDSADEVVSIINRRNPCFHQDFKSAKIVRLLSDINELKNQAKEEGRYMDKVLVISQWTTLLNIIDRHLIKAGYSTVSITGRQTLDERAEAMNSLNNNLKRPQIMLLSLAAGGVGLNLVGANHVFFMDIHWNPQLELQAQDRVHRYGQLKAVKVVRYISKDTMEERIVKLQMSKLELADGILSNSKKTQGGGLTIAQLKTLFEL